MCSKYAFLLTRAGKILDGGGLTDSHSTIATLHGVDEDLVNRYEWQPPQNWPDADVLDGLATHEEFFTPDTSVLRRIAAHLTRKFPTIGAFQAHTRVDDRWHEETVVLNRVKQTILVRGRYDLRNGTYSICGTAEATVGGSARIQFIRDSAVVHHVGDSATIQNVRDSAVVHRVGDLATIHHVGDFATIYHVGGSATIQDIGRLATIHYVRDSAVVDYVRDSATIRCVGDSATIRCVGGSAIIQNVIDSATIQDVDRSATIHYVGGSATIQNISDLATIQDVGGSATIIGGPYWSLDAVPPTMRERAVLIDRRGGKIVVISAAPLEIGAATQWAQRVSHSRPL